MTDQRTEAALANDIEKMLKSHRAGDSYPYFEQINQMIQGRTTFQISHADMPDDTAKELITNSRQVIQGIKDAVLSILREIHPDYEQEIRDKLQVEITDFENEVPLKELGAEYRGQLVSVTGKATALSDPELTPITLVHRCGNCSEYLEGDREITKCPKCGERDVAQDDEATTYDDIQYIKINEIKPANNQIAKLTILVQGKHNIWKVRAGQKIKAVGNLVVLKIKERNKTRYLKRLDAITITPLDYKDAEYIVTPADIERFKKEMDEPQFYEKVRASFAPFLVNLEEIKDACILTLASVKTVRPLNFLMVGDPSKAKSVIMEYVAQLADNGHFASGANTTWAGLSVTSEKDHDTEAWILKYGLFPLADEGLACIDEIQNYHEEELMKMNEVLESKRVSYAKAGGNSGELPSRCAVILACNPHHGKWLKGANLQDNLRFMGRAREAFISRMSIIFILQDAVDEATDRAVAQSVLENSGLEMFQKYHEDTAELWGSRTLKKFFSWLTTQPFPTIPQELNEELVNFYVNARNKNTDGTVTPRYLADAKRLAQMRARVLGKATIDKTDVDFAVDLLQKSLNEAAFDPKTQKIDANIIQGTIAASTQAERQSKEDQFYEAFDKACLDDNGENKGYATESDIAFWLVQWKWPDNIKTERYIHNMLTRTGRFMEKHGQGRWSKL